MADVPRGYTLDEESAPPPPRGYTLDAEMPPPPKGFVLDATPGAAETPSSSPDRPEGAGNRQSPGVTDYLKEGAKRVAGGAASFVSGSLKGAGVATADMTSYEPMGGDILGPIDVVEPLTDLYRSPKDLKSNSLFQAGQAVDRFVKKTLQPQKGVLPELAEDVLSGFGQVGATVATAMVPFAGLPLAIGGGVLQGMGEAGERALEAGATPEEQIKAGRLGSIAGATEFVDTALPALGAVGKSSGVIMKVLKRMGVGGAVEGLQEGVQQFIQNMIAQGVYKPDQKLDEQVIYSAIVGGIVGGTASPAFGALKDRADAKAAGPFAGMSEEEIRSAIHETIKLMEGPLPAPETPPVPTSGVPQIPQEAREAFARGGSTRTGTNVFGGEEVTEAPAPPASTTAAPKLEEGKAQAQTTPSVQQDPEWYYSQVAKAAQERLPSTGSAEQILATLKQSPGVKGEELEWLGIEDWLRQQKGPVSKTDLLEHIEENAVRIETSVAGEYAGEPVPLNWRITRQFPNIAGSRTTWFEADDAPGLRIRHTDTPGAFFHVLRDDVTLGSFTTLDRAQEYASRRTRPRARYGDWTVPGGENYREVKLVWANNPGDPYLEPHFGKNEPNIIAHIRVDDRTDVDGRKVLHVNEMQSEWARQMRTEGVKVTPEERVAARDEYERLNKELNDAIRQRRAQGVTGAITDLGELRGRLGAAYDNYLRTQESNSNKVPKAPFKSSWFELTTKRILRMAADEGYDAVSFSDANDQLTLYDMGSEPKSVRWFTELYDQIIPRTVAKWAKRLGGKMQDVTHIIPELDQAPGVGEFASGPRRYIGVTLTPEMRTRIRQGVPLFAEVKQGIRAAQGVTTAQIKRMIPDLERMRLVVVALSRRMGMNFPIDFSLLNDPNNSHRGEATWRYDGTTKDLVSANIMLNMAHLKSLADIYQTVAHEFGHLVIEQHFDKAPAATQIRIMADYDAWLAERSPQEAFRSMIASRDNFTEQVYRGQQVTLAPLVSLTPEQRRYWLGFDEYMAEQIARWMTTNERPLTVVDRFFKNLADVLRKAYLAFQQRWGTAEPTAAVGEWLNQLHDEPFRPGKYLVFNGMTLRTARANQLAMDEDGATIDAVPISTASADIRSALAQLPLPQQTVQQAKANAAYVDHFNKFYKTMAALQQVADLNQHIPQLQRYREIIQQWQVEKSEMIDSATRTVKRWSGLNAKKQDAVSGMMDDYLNMRYLTPAEVAAGTERLPTAPEIAQMAAKNKVDRAGMGVFVQVVKDFDNLLVLKYRPLLRQEARKISDPIARALRFQEIDKLITRLRNKPFIPAMRFGNYSVKVHDAAGTLIWSETFSSKRKRNAALRQMDQQINKAAGETISAGYIAKDARPFIGMPAGLLDMMEQKLNLSSTQKEAMEELKFDFHMARRFHHRFERNDRTPGYSKDFLRAYGNFFFYGAHHFTRLKYLDQAKAEQLDLKASAEGMKYQGSGTENAGTKRGMLAEFVQDHLNAMVDPKQDFAVLRSLGFLFFLGFSPVAAIQNLSQIPMTTYPYLASKFGDLKAAGAIRRASTDMTSYYRRGSLATQSAEELQALSKAVEVGAITEAQASELAALAEGRTLTRNRNGVGKVVNLQWWVEQSAKMFEAAEQFNRRVTFRAAYKLARENPGARYIQDAIAQHELQYKSLLREGWTPERAAAFTAAKDVTEKTQFIYSSYGQPSYTRGLSGHAKTVLIFTTFYQNMMMFLWNNWSAAARSLLIMGLLGGLMGLPGAETAKDLIKLLAKALSKDFDVEKELREFIVQLLGDNEGDAEWADTLLHGMSRVGFGVPQVLQHLGVPGPKPGNEAISGQIDMSRSLSLGRVPVLNIGALASSTDPDRAATQFTQSAAGAVFGYPFNLWKFMNGDWTDRKNMERIMPRQAAAMSRAWRAFDTGAETTYKGDTLVRFDKTDWWQMAEIIAMGLGFQTLRMTREWDRISAEAEQKSFYGTRRQLILRQLYMSQGDPDEFEKVMKRVDAFNDEVKDSPGFAYELTPSVIRKSFQIRQEEEQARESGIPRRRMERPIAADVQRIYPKARIVDEKPVR